MYLQKLCLLTVAATLAASTNVGMLDIQVREFEVPTPKSRPHDPALAPDGSLWYTGQGANKLGRLDPKSGEFKEYALKTPNSGPHGLVADKEGDIWFTAISGGYIGKLNPKNGEITEYRPHRWNRDRSTHSRIRSQRHSVVYQRRDQLYRAARSENRKDRLDQITYAARCALRHRDLAEQHAAVLRVRYEQAGEY